MGIRFRRRVTIAPGVSLNISKSGLGISVGPRGAKIGIGPRGVHHSLGIPGTGLVYRKDASWNSGGSASRSTVAGLDEVVVGVREDGTVQFTGESGQPLAPAAERAARAALGPRIRELIEEVCAKFTAESQAVLRVHEATPAPNIPLAFAGVPFAEKAPEPPTLATTGFLGAVWRPHRRRIEAANEARQRAYSEAMAAWSTAKAHHEAREAEALTRFEAARSGDPKEMELLLSDRLARFDWPRQTHVSYEVTPDGRSVHLDIDLPEIEDMPTEVATAATRGLRVNTKVKSETQVRKEYMQHVHGVLFRVIGEVFHALPAVGEVIASGFTQRADPATGAIRDDYLISTRCARRTWQEIDFTNLGALDLILTFERFETRRKVTKTGFFTPIEPHLGRDSVEAL